MATNKQAMIRYIALDKCFNNFGKKFYISDLIEACNIAIEENTGLYNGVQKRQIYDDIKFMESDAGWSIPLERYKDGRKIYYRYSDKSFSINNKGLNPYEVEQIKSTISILSRFKGIPQSEWIEEIKIRMENVLGLKDNSVPVVEFDENPYLEGLKNFTPLFNAIQNKQALEVQYKGFKQQKAQDIIFHPWFLKQYNERWFIFGYNEHYHGLSNLALDRIISMSSTSTKYIENKDIDFQEFFEDVVGVSVNTDDSIETIIVKIDKELWPYIESKPLHGSQIVLDRTDDSVKIKCQVRINHELIALLFSYMDGIEVLEPISLRDKFKSISESILKKYQ